MTKGAVLILKSLSLDVNVLDALSQKNEKHIDVAKKLILLSIISCFVNFWLARGVIVVSVLMFFTLPGINKVAFAHKGSLMAFPFCVIGFIVSLCYGNIYGIVSYPMFFAIMYFCLVARSIMTETFLEQMLDVMCLGGCIASGIAIIEQLVNIKHGVIRATAGFPNPNFLGAALMVSVMVSVYKVAAGNKNTRFYIITGAINGLGILLCGSMSLWVVMAISGGILFALNKNRGLLMLLGGVIVLGALALIIKPTLISRLSELSATIGNRVKIWDFAWENIKSAPIFGRGFFTYKHMYYKLLPVRPDLYKASLSHNLLLDSVHCHGIVGTCMVLSWIAIYFKDFFSCRKKLKNSNQSMTYNSFVLALCIGVLIYGLIDTTFVWVQSGTLLLLIMGGIGSDENKFRTN